MDRGGGREDMMHFRWFPVCKKKKKKEEELPGVCREIFVIK